MSRLAICQLATCLLVSAVAAGCTAEVDGSDPLSEAALSNPEETAFNYFVAKGLTKTESAAIVGNLIQESSVNPASVEYGGGPGRGIAQWSVGGRWDTSTDDNATWFASTHGESRAGLTTQLDFIWYELTTFSGYGLSELRAATTLTAAVEAFQDKFEVCGACAQGARIADAELVLNNYGGGTSTGSGSGSGSGSSSSGGGAECYSETLGKDMPDDACVQSKFDSDWYQCANGEWVDRWTDPEACVSVTPL